MAVVRIADGASIYKQLVQLHALYPSETFGDIEKQVRIKTWSLEEKTCPAVRIQAAKFQSMRVKVPFSPDLVLDAPSFEFQVSGGSTKSTFSLWDSKDPLVKWAMQTRRALAQCGAAESGPVARPNSSGH